MTLPRPSHEDMRRRERPIQGRCQKCGRKVERSAKLCQQCRDAKTTATSPPMPAAEKTITLVILFRGRFWLYSNDRLLAVV